MGEILDSKLDHPRFKLQNARSRWPEGAGTPDFAGEHVWCSYNSSTKNFSTHKDFWEHNSSNNWKNKHLQTQIHNPIHRSPSFNLSLTRSCCARQGAPKAVHDKLPGHGNIYFWTGTRDLPMGIVYFTDCHDESFWIRSIGDVPFSLHVEFIQQVPKSHRELPDGSKACELA